jgi:hypothetical protein
MHSFRSHRFSYATSLFDTCTLPLLAAADMNDTSESFPDDDVDMLSIMVDMVQCNNRSQNV